MSRRTTGAILIAVSAILYATRYLTAGLYASSQAGWSRELFEAMLQYVGPELAYWSAAALAAGIGYLVWAEVEVLRKGSWQ